MQPLRADDIAATTTTPNTKAGVVAEAAAEVRDTADDYQRQLLRLLNTLQRENMQLRAQLRTDPLTRLFSRRAFFDELEREWEHWLRYRHTASLILVDVNAFKAINDTHGHQIGDDVLVSIAQQLSQQVRASDWIARLGGDEFAILVRDTSAIDAEQLADKLRETQFVFHGDSCSDNSKHIDPPLVVHCSVGVATLDSDIKSIRQWLEAADQLMYRHKRSVYLRPSSIDSTLPYRAEINAR
jgi:diguanylate cyclase (GGDEF)-like protein